MVEHSESDRPNWSDLSIGQISHIFLLLVKTWHMEKEKIEWKNGKKEKKKLDAVTTAPTGVPTRFSFKTWTHTVTSLIIYVKLISKILRRPDIPLSTKFIQTLSNNDSNSSHWHWQQ